MADMAMAIPQPSRSGRAMRRFWVAPPLTILALLFFYPLGLILRQALEGDQHVVSLAGFDAVLRSNQFLSGLFHTITIALTASAGCLVLGFVLSLIISFIPFPGARLIGRLIDTFIALPTFLVALAFTFIYGSAGLINQSLMHMMHLDLPPLHFLYSQWGVILAEITVYTPFVMRPLLANFSLIDAAQIEVASSLGARPWRIVRQIILPAALPALIAGGSLCLLLTVNEFGIVLFIGAKGVITLPLLIYDKAIQEFDYTTACIIAVVNIVLSLGLYALYRLAVSYFGGRRVSLG
ncbi:2-aminoethylphosphonate ABC transporter permease subunit [Paralcaligenes ureilyticus]|uniref:2-aminoethylphosphonate transport system permease protein n=1 Tax=Paralcaligenes ureilyticus TaxID=627131 RepID=A0A4R3M7V8_9BURK|nr:2-aminoethylphosphonate ABC transporter permease subunit [Paralcaligenes ureilyticus]TCT07415.1 2-aminoethylphosphonate transport system permease protein [Paralcaligenes ureilyticus]